MGDFNLSAKEIWRARLEESRVVYEQATAHFTAVLSEQKLRPIPATDGALAIRQARLNESAAREEYMKVLKIFTDLVLSDKTPGS